MHNGQTVGPIDETEILHLIQSGSIKRETQVWTGAMSAWSAATDTPLSVHFSALPPKLPPMQKEKRLTAWGKLAINFLAMFVVAYVTLRVPDDLNTFVFLFSRVGIPAVLAGLITGIYFLFQKKKDGRVFRRNFVVVTWICLGLIILGERSSVSSRNARYDFSPSYCDFLITFSSKPKIREIQVDGLKGERAELEKGLTATIAEAVTIPSETSRTVTKEEVFAELEGIATRSGLDHPEFYWKMGEVGPIATMKSFKTLLHEGREIRITYTTLRYYGPKSLFAITAACPSENYPTPTVLNFLDSVVVKK